MEGDTERAYRRRAELDELYGRFYEIGKPYETVVKAAAKGARVSIRETLGFGEHPGLRSMLIDGVLLAKEIARRAGES